MNIETLEGGHPGQQVDENALGGHVSIKMSAMPTGACSMYGYSIEPAPRCPLKAAVSQL